MKLKLTSLLVIAMGLGASAQAADQYFMRTPAPAKCATAPCVMKSVLPGSPATPTTPDVPEVPEDPNKIGIPTLAAASVAFPDWSLGMGAVEAPVTLRNTGEGPISITSASILPSSGTVFTIKGTTCTAKLSAGKSCTYTVAWAPTTYGVNKTFVQALRIVTNGGTVNGKFSGTSIMGVGALDSNSLIFGDIAVGATSNAQNVVLSNTGGAPLTISSVALTAGSADYVVGSGDCVRTLAVGASCSFPVSFKPSVPDQLLGSVRVTHNGQSGGVAVSLTGGVLAARAQLNYTGTFTFPDLSIAEAATGAGYGQNLFLLNTGGRTLTISGISTTGAAYSVSRTTCGASLAPGASCEIDVMFSAKAQSNSGALTVNSNSSRGPVTLLLEGRGL